jgi:hypothetical protein
MASHAEAHELCRLFGLSPRDNDEAHQLAHLIALRETNPAQFKEWSEDVAARERVTSAATELKRKAETYERMMRALGRDPNQERN